MNDETDREIYENMWIRQINTFKILMRDAQFTHREEMTLTNTLYDCLNEATSHIFGPQK